MAEDIVTNVDKVTPIRAGITPKPGESEETREELLDGAIAFLDQCSARLGILTASLEHSSMDHVEMRRDLAQFIDDACVGGDIAHARALLKDLKAREVTP